jgi:hypothetical protein
MFLEPLPKHSETKEAGHGKAALRASRHYSLSERVTSSRLDSGADHVFDHTDQFLVFVLAAADAAERTHFGSVERNDIIV